MRGPRALALALLGIPLAGGIEVERVRALVNGVPVLSSDVELAKIAALVPRLATEDETQYERAVLESLIALTLRYQELEAAHISEQLSVDWERAWAQVVHQAGGEEEISRKLAAAGLSRESLVRLIRRAAVVEAYVAKRFLSSLRVSQEEVQQAYEATFSPGGMGGENRPPLSQVRSQLEALVKERKLKEAVERWTQELAQRAEIIRYLR